jgi:hypothetical protein
MSRFPEPRRLTLEKQLITTPLGELFFKFNALNERAWAADAELGASVFPTLRHENKVREQWRAADEARLAFLEALAIAASVA